MPDWMRMPMYRSTQLQGPGFDAEGLLPRDKAEDCEESWAGPFRREVLPILLEVEGQFAEMYDPSTGRPNRSVALLLGVHILKEMNDQTDQEVLDGVKFDTRYWWAFQMDLREMRLSQKTLHNFRVKLIENKKAKLPFREVTDRLIPLLGVNVAQQRLDSTQILSNIAVLTRLGVFCETIRLFVREVKKVDGKLYEAISEGIRRRHGGETEYHDARSKEGVRRLAVAARDVWRLVEQFQKEPRVTEIGEWKLLKRVLDEQCVVREDAKGPEEGDGDQGEGSAPVEVKAAKEVRSDSLQTPHDPEVTYSGHKGKGYAVQIAETCGQENEARLIAEVDVTPACRSDAKATVPMVSALEEAGHKPVELVADTTYSGAENAAALADKDVNLLSPAPAAAKPDPSKTYPPPEEKCPKDREGAAEWLKRQEASPSFKKRYAIRAGIEGTNSEFKRAHGGRKLRVRGGLRVNLVVYLKALACNVKRALRWWRERVTVVEGAAVPG